MTTQLIVTVDTEEEGLWSGRYRRTGNTVENVRGVPRFQSLCDRYGVRPTYLVDAPVVEDNTAVEILRSIQDDGRCEIGAHVHPWCNPPFEEVISERNSFLCNLPEPLQRAKIEWLTRSIEKRFGRRPTSFRAGRYGLDAAGARMLVDMGYRVDTSVLPFTDYSSRSGPNFDRAPCQPYYPSANDLTRPVPTGRLLELPITVGYNRVNFERAHAVRRLAMTRILRRLRTVGILDRLGIIRRVKLCPEQADAQAMNRLIDNSFRRGASCVVLMFHSSSLMPGGSSYVPDEASLHRFYRELTAVFEHFLQSLGGRTTTLIEYASLYRDTKNTGPAVSVAKRAGLVDCDGVVA